MMSMKLSPRFVSVVVADTLMLTPLKLARASLCSLFEGAK